MVDGMIEKKYCGGKKFYGVIINMIILLVIIFLCACYIYNKGCDYKEVYNIFIQKMGWNNSKANNDEKDLLYNNILMDLRLKVQNVLMKCNIKIPEYNLYGVEDGSSKTINKKNIYLLLVDKNGNLYNNNTLFKVLIHEISHVLNKTDGHDINFTNIYSTLLTTSKNMGYYDERMDVQMQPCMN
ncbi:Transmembrane domain-containing protein [Orpheovirus IHUMI-LCC2]|uniref:Transmembrane domain-containing protein n=1 Tax=Orpheovirus IHUMI-LCC2 TaxID=2023057 RepID=A0A2I2L644_9VIRU|nr:Transmembrane domain-containing protein [Orpheovirus IHUMI-LCC2]SNW62929.1 Transmembrane domain-containing protein [Orpheovirus IHUMI-LCC2]